MNEHVPNVGTASNSREAGLAPRAIPHRGFREKLAGPELRRGFGARLPWGVAGMLLLIGLIEFSIARAGSIFFDTICYSWSFSARALPFEAPRSEIILMGDSLMKHGVVASVIEAGTERRTYNLATAAGPAPITGFLLERLLKTGARPRAIVFDLKPSMLAASPRYRIRQWQEILTTGEAVAYARQAGSVKFAVELFLGRLLPSLRARHDIRSELAAALQGKVSPNRRANDICARHWAVNAGSHVVPPNPAFNGRLTEQQQMDVLSHRFKLHRVNASAARGIARLAATHGIHLYLLVPPFSPEVIERRGQTGVDKEYEEFLHGLQAQNPAMTIVDARLSGYPASVFVDATHLDGRGAVSLSRDVAAVLKQDLASDAGSIPEGRWLRLPSYSEAPQGLAIEDTERSRQLLGIPDEP